jgi:DUF1365 family protein
MVMNVPHFLLGHVMHERTLPKRNAFTYGVYYLAIPLSQIGSLSIPVNRSGLISFHESDHGSGDGQNLEKWVRGVLNQYSIKEADGEVILICMPRVMGYVFNPVSFWICHDKSGKIRAILCEVNNTFGERHVYLCVHNDHREIKSNDILMGQKMFHVSPMLERSGHYTFRFHVDDNKFGVWINFYNQQQDKQLLTSLTGSFEPITRKTATKIFWSYPLITLKVIALIHWQALKTLAKGIPYIAKPAQKEETITITTDHDKKSEDTI